jgi:glycosyltransferase involved in cell wall biosynthesis
MFFEKSLVANASSVHFLGESEESGLKKVVRKFKSVLVPNGQDDIENRPQNSSSYNRELIFGFCGRLDIHTKGLDLLTDGFAAFIKQYDNAKLVMIGDGEDREELQKRCTDLGIMNKVQFLGSKFGQEKYEILATLDAFFHPSRNEGLPTAVLEAAALGVPCVVSHESNMKGYIQAHSSGIGLQENSAEKLTDSMVTIATLKRNGEIARLQENCEIMIKKEFDWKIIAERLVQTYSAFG